MEYVSGHHLLHSGLHPTDLPMLNFGVLYNEDADRTFFFSFLQQPNTTAVLTTARAADDQIQNNMTAVMAEVPVSCVCVCVCVCARARACVSMCVHVHV